MCVCVCAGKMATLVTLSMQELNYIKIWSQALRKAAGSKIAIRGYRYIEYEI